jgi:hypothetical protein
MTRFEQHVHVEVDQVKVDQVEVDHVVVEGARRPRMTSTSLWGGSQKLPSLPAGNAVTGSLVT